MADDELINSPHVDEGTMHAWLDGALSADESDTVELHVANCATCSAAAAEARGLIAASTRILSALDDVPGDVIPAKVPIRTGRVGVERSVRRYAPIAAVALFGIAATLMLRGNPTLVEQRGSNAERSVVDSPTAAPSQPSPLQPTPEVATAGTTSAGTAHAAPIAQESASSRAARAAEPMASSSSSVAAKRIASAPDTRALGVVETAKSQVESQFESQAKSQAKLQTKSQLEPSGFSQGVAAALATSAHRDSLVIKGRVTAAATGLPLAAAYVSLLGSGVSTTTDSNGAFTIPKVPLGTHTLTARRIGFTASTAQVDVTTDRPPDVTFALPRTSGAMSDVVVTGLAVARSDEFSKAPPEMLGARIVSSSVRDEGDSRVRRTTYQIGSGAPVVLAEYRSGHITSIVRQHFDTVGSTMHLMLRGQSQAAHSVTWMASDSTVFVLSGQMSESELDALKRRIVP